MDQAGRPFVGVTLCGRDVAGIAVALPQCRPPFLFKPFFEGGGVENAEGESTDAFRVLGHKGELPRKEPISAGIEVAQNASLAIERGCILAVVADQQADLVDRSQISRAIAANDCRHGGLRRGPFPLWRGQG